MGLSNRRCLSPTIVTGVEKRKRVWLQIGFSFWELEVIGIVYQLLGKVKGSQALQGFSRLPGTKIVWG